VTNKDEIKELFSKSFEGFEKEVDPGLWDKIQSNLNTPNVGNTGQAASAGKAGLIKSIIIGTVSVASIAGAVVLYNSNTSENGVEENKQASKEIENTDKILIIDNTSDDKLTDKIDTSKDPLIVQHREEIKKEIIQDLQDAKIINKEELEFNNADINDLLDKDLLDKLGKVETKKEQQTNKEERLKIYKADSESPEEIPGALIVLTDYKVKEVSGGFKVSFSTSTSIEGSYVWDFGNGETSTEKEPTVVYNNKGIYNVKLIATTSNGRKVEEDIVVKAFEESSMVVPNVFTPNGDGTNDFLTVSTKGIKEFGLTVVTLTGKVLYETSDVNFKWDGRIQTGEKLEKGTYIIVVAAIGEDGKKHVQSSGLRLEK